MKKHKLFKINDTYYMSNLEPIYEEDIIKLVDERDKYKKILDKIKEIINHYAVENEDYSKLYNQEEQEIMKLLEEIE